MISIRRADYWLVEEVATQSGIRDDQFQSAGRIIGWLKVHGIRRKDAGGLFQSAGRIIGWLKFLTTRSCCFISLVSIRRADYWLVEGRTHS